MPEKSTIGERIDGLFQMMGYRMKAPEEPNPKQQFAGVTESMIRQVATDQNGNLGGISAMTLGTRDGAEDFVMRARIPEWLYRAPFGIPIYKNIPEIRRLAATPYIGMISNKIVNTISDLPWKISVRKEYEGQVPDEIVEKTKLFFWNPNRNEESFSTILRSLVRDMVEVDAGVIVKIRNHKDELMEIYTYDGATFTKAPDIYGVLPDFNAYYQYMWAYVGNAVPFARNEVVYLIRNRRTDTVYGRSEVENVFDVLRMLQYGIEYNLEYFIDNNIPKGFVKMPGASQNQTQKFQNEWVEQLRKRDVAGNFKKYFHKMPVINVEATFEKIAMSSLDLELLSGQAWFMKLVLAQYGVPQSTLGFGEDANRATAMIDTGEFKRTACLPYLNLLEYHIDTELINDLPWIKGKYEDKLHFDFDKEDLGMENARRQIIWGDWEKGLAKLNEVREKAGYEPESGEKGEEYKSEGIGMGFGLSTSELNRQDAEDGLKDDPAAEGEVPKKNESANPKDVEKKSLPGVIVSANSVSFPEPETKALNATSIIRMASFEVPAPKSEAELKKKIRKELQRIEAELLGQFEPEDVELKADAWTQITQTVKLDKVFAYLYSMVKSFYDKGLDKSGEKLGRNFTGDPRAVQFLQQYNFDLVRGLEADTRDKLKMALKEGIVTGQSKDEIAKAIKTAMGSTYSRAEAIAETESLRALNAGAIQGWKESGIDGVMVWKSFPEKCQVCQRMDGQRVPLGGFFVDSHSGTSVPHPPAHPRCRCIVEFRETDKSIPEHKWLVAKTFHETVPIDKPVFVVGRHFEPTQTFAKQLKEAGYEVFEAPVEYREPQDSEVKREEYNSFLSEFFKGRNVIDIHSDRSVSPNTAQAFRFKENLFGVEVSPHGLSQDALALFNRQLQDGIKEWKKLGIVPPRGYK